MLQTPHDPLPNRLLLTGTELPAKCRDAGEGSWVPGSHRGYHALKFTHLLAGAGLVLGPQELAQICLLEAGDHPSSVENGAVSAWRALAETKGHGESPHRDRSWKCQQSFPLEPAP